MTIKKFLEKIREYGICSTDEIYWYDADHHKYIRATSLLVVKGEGMVAFSDEEFYEENE